MIGIILAGGKSLKMADEMTAITMPGGLTMAQLAYQKLTDIHLTTYLSVPPLQRGDVELWGELPLIVDQVEINAKGPLLGLLSAHRKFPMEDIFVLACNMPLMKIQYLQDLYDLWQERISDIYVYEKNGRAEPFCGIYTYHALRQISQLVEDGLKKESSVQYYVQRLNTCHKHIAPEAESALEIIYSKKALNQLSLFTEMAI